MEAAETALLTDDPRHAITLWTAALAKSSSTECNIIRDQKIDILEKRAEVYISLHEQERARLDFQAALDMIVTTEKSPCEQQRKVNEIESLEHQASLHMYIGQLQTEKEALESYQRGMECLKRILQRYEKDGISSPSMITDTSDTEPMQISCNYNTEEEDQQSNLLATSGSPQISHAPLLEHYQKLLVTACCTVAELYLTDLCYEDDAEQQCEQYLQQAIGLLENSETTSTFLDAWQTLANLRLSQSRHSEAVDLMLRHVYGGMAVGCQALASLVGVRYEQPTSATLVATNDTTTNAKELLQLTEVQNLPDFEFRCQSAKLLLECGNSADDSGRRGECAWAAVDVLGSLLAENDDVIEVWMLLGDAYALLDENQEERGNALSVEYWERALEMLTTVQQTLEEEQSNCQSQEEEDEVQQELDQVLGQAEELRSKIEASVSEQNGDTAMEEE
jgi:tetratricopeptide (TPR) repeat protein